MGEEASASLAMPDMRVESQERGARSTAPRCDCRTGRVPGDCRQHPRIDLRVDGDVEVVIKETPAGLQEQPNIAFHEGFADIVASGAPL